MTNNTISDKFILNIKWFFIVYNLLFIFYIFLEYSPFVNEKFPQPFSFYFNDTFMDFYNVNFHALNYDFYNGNFKSIYTPIFRFISEILTPLSCKKLDSSVELKQCDYFLPYIYLIFFVLNTITLSCIFGQYNSKFIFILLFNISFPLLFALERGNYIIFCALYINIILLINSKKIIYYLLLLLPLLKIYFIINFFIYLVESTNKFFKMFFLFLLISIIIWYLSEDNFIFFVNNIFSFSKRINHFDILNATSLSPILKYIDLSILNIFYAGFKIYLLLRMYVFMCFAVRVNNISVNEIKFILFVLILFCIIILSSIGFYSVILIYPFAAFLIARNLIDNYEKFLILLTTIPLPFEIFQYEFVENNLIYLNVQSLLMPILLILLYLSITKIERFKNEN
jgi:hypothetical protein